MKRARPKPRKPVVRRQTAPQPEFALALAVVTCDHTTAMGLLAAGADPWTPVDSSGRLLTSLLGDGDEIMRGILEAAMRAADPERYLSVSVGPEPTP